MSHGPVTHGGTFPAGPESILPAGEYWVAVYPSPPLVVIRAISTRGHGRALLRPYTSDTTVTLEK